MTMQMQQSAKTLKCFGNLDLLSFHTEPKFNLLFVAKEAQDR